MTYKLIEVDLNCLHCGVRSKGFDDLDNPKFVWVFGRDDPPEGEYHDACHEILAAELRQSLD